MDESTQRTLWSLQHPLFLPFGKSRSECEIYDVKIQTKIIQFGILTSMPENEYFRESIIQS